MEVPGGKDNKCFVCLYEMIGTAILIGALNLSSGKAEAVTIALFCIAIFLGPVSGGHVNPAVSTAVFIKEKNPANLPFFFMIILSQFIGAFLGIGIATAAQTKNATTGAPVPGIAQLCPNAALSRPHNSSNLNGPVDCATKDGTAAFNVVLVEIIGTGIFVSVIMSVVYYNKASGPVTALAVGGTLFGMAKTIGGISGGCMNPAVGLA
jgi:glycerol uptake facilitator-like aquaporin